MLYGFLQVSSHSRPGPHTIKSLRSLYIYIFFNTRATVASTTSAEQNLGWRNVQRELLRGITIQIQRSTDRVIQNNQLVTRLDQ